MLFKQLLGITLFFTKQMKSCFDGFREGYFWINRLKNFKHLINVVAIVHTYLMKIPVFHQRPCPYNRFPTASMGLSMFNTFNICNVHLERP